MPGDTSGHGMAASSVASDVLSSVMDCESPAGSRQHVSFEVCDDMSALGLGVRENVFRSNNAATKELFPPMGFKSEKILTTSFMN